MMWSTVTRAISIPLFEKTLRVDELKLHEPATKSIVGAMIMIGGGIKSIYC